MKSDFVLPQKLPLHIAFIMDGNGRWAQKRLLPRKAGHRAGVKTLRRVVRDCFNAGIKYVTLYAFSTENRNRPQEEVNALFGLMEEYFKEFLGEMLNDGIKVTVMGELSYFPENLRNIITDAVNSSAQCKNNVLNLALNYGSKSEILRAVNAAVRGGKEITQEELDKLMYTSDIPDPDLIVRTGGECRLSNFMLYQGAYSELFFTKTLWPDFNKKDLYKILDDYSKRDRRYGKVK